jgi:exosortase A-associated hydrolase 1
MREEIAVNFACGDARLYGILHLPSPASPAAALSAPTAVRGVLVVVGGPQYRAGSHRQFTLLARFLAAGGVPVMRFDYRGMGDSEGELRDFAAVDDDLRAAVDHFLASVPGMTEVALWGLCDGATAAGMYAAGDRRVTGLALLNPWIRTDSGIAAATLKHYYRGRLLERAFWTKLLRGRFDAGRALRSALGLVRDALVPAPAPAGAPAPLPDRLLAALARFDGHLLVMLSGADLTAKEFDDGTKGSDGWRRLLGAPRVTRHWLDQADHTCSRRAWQDQVSGWTRDWIGSW